MPGWIDADMTTLAFLWRVERRDGVTLGFTSHDADIRVGGVTYRAAPGMLPSAIERSDGLDTDNVELSGALSHDAIRAEDLMAGRWDGAALTLSAVDWTAPGADPVPLIRGDLGSVEVSGDSFTVALRGPTAALEAASNEETSPDCRAQLGDKRCRVDMAAYRRTATVTAIIGAVVTVDAIAPDGAFAFGLLRWIDGDNSGLESRIIASVGAALTLEEPPPFPVLTGTRVETIQGCDKRFETCVQRFANAANFRGEPHLPGNDLLTRYAS